MICTIFAPTIIHVHVFEKKTEINWGYMNIYLLFSFFQLQRYHLQSYNDAEYTDHRPNSAYVSETH